MAVIIGTSNISGSANADIIVSTATLLNASIVHGNGGSDVIIGDHAATQTDEASSNNVLAAARSIDDSAFWATGNNPLVGDASIPYTTIVSAGTGTLDFYKVTLEAGATLTLDVDFAFGGFGGASFDSEIAVLNSSNTILASNDDGSLAGSGLGSISARDSNLVFTATTAGTYFIRIGAFPGSGPIATGSTYLLNVSATSHAATAVLKTLGDTLYGDAANDYIVGGTASDNLYGGIGDDTVFGADGNDFVFGDGGNDTLDGGIGVDWLDFTTWNKGVSISLAAQGTFQDTGAGLDFLTGFEYIRGTGFGDSLTGDGNGNSLYGNDGDDTLSGEGGSDQLFAGFGTDTATGGEGNDALYLTSGAAGWDVDVPAGLATYSDGISSGSTTFGGIETIITSAGNDRVTLGGIATTVFLGTADDRLIMGTAHGIIDGESGNDTVDVSAVFTRRGFTYVINLTTGFTSFTGEQIRSFENLVSEGATPLNVTGTSDVNLLSGGSGRDTLFGADGNDLLDGNLGNDVLRGGAGVDLITGGAGRDMFLFRAGESGTKLTTADLIVDFSQIDDDWINLSQIDANSATIGLDPFTFIGNAVFTGQAGELRYYFSRNETIVAGDTNGNGTADFLIRLTGAMTLNAGDFEPPAAMARFEGEAAQTGWSWPTHIVHPIADHIL